MTPEAEELSRALAAAPDWPWQVRMSVRPLLADGTVEDVVGTVTAVGELVYVEWPDVGSRSHDHRGHLLPDLDDPATTGILLGMLDASYELLAWRDFKTGTISVTVVSDRGIFTGSTLGFALARSLLSVRR